MASPISPIECSICLEDFNDTTHRPKVLQCGHSFCGTCLKQCIAKGEHTCATCRAPHNATSVDDIPVNISMESLIKTQFPFVETLKEAHHNIDSIEFVIDCLETIVSEKNDSIISKEALILTLQKEIDEDMKARDHAQADISVTKSIHSQLKCCIENIQTATENKIVFQRYLELSNLFEDIENDNYMGLPDHLLLTSPKQALATLRKSRIPVYAVDNEMTISRASKVKRICGLLEVASLEKDVIPPPKSLVLSVSSLLSATSEQPVIYLGLEAGGRSLGRVRIRLTCGPRRREQMLHLCTATQGGATFKGSWADEAADVGRAGENIKFFKYMTPDGERSDDLIVQDLEDDKCDPWVEGAVTGYMNDASFDICTRTAKISTKMGPGDTAPELGRVVSGLDLLRQALCQYTDIKEGLSRNYNASQINIAEAGVQISG